MSVFAPMDPPTISGPVSPSTTGPGFASTPAVDPVSCQLTPKQEQAMRDWVQGEREAYAAALDVPAR